MNSINKIALIGATGNLGQAVLNALLAARYQVTILSREGSTSTDSLPSHPNQKIVKVDFDSVQAITTALAGIEGVVSNVASQALASQTKIIDAAIAAGTVRRFLPSEFGSDLGVERNARVPFNKYKVDTTHYLEEQAKLHTDFSYSIMTNGPFLDWCLSHGLFADLKNHAVTLWDGGETKFSTTTLATIGKSVVAVFRNLEATRNKHVYVQDTVISQNDIVRIVKEIDGVEWTVTQGSTTEALQKSLEEMKKPEPNMRVVVMNQLCPVLFNKEHEPDFSKKLHNDVLGLDQMSEQQVKEVIRNVVLG